MTLHITGTGWYGIENECNGHCGPRMDCCEAPLDLPAEIAAAIQPCPNCEGRGVIRHHLREPHASIRYADPCPDCHEGHPTIGVTVNGRVERQAIVRKVVPVVEWGDVDIGTDYPLPCVTTDPHGNSLLVSDRGPDDFYATHIDLHDADNGTHVAYIEVLA